MKVHVFKDSQAVAKAAAMIFAAQMSEKPDSVLGLATGATPVETYKEIISLYNDGQIDFAKAHSYNLDEYIGLEPDHPQSYRYFMQEQLFNHINIDPQNTHVPSGIARDLAAVCAAYDAAIKSDGGIDLQLLGIGKNAHIGFNEPSDHFSKGTLVADLTESTINANAKFFDSADEMPRQAVSMGIASIMKSRKILLIALGEDKAKAISDMVNGPITPQVPASILQLHDNVIVLLDKAAASLL